MSVKLPYPGWNPNLRVVDRVGDKYRTCMIVDILSDSPLTNGQSAALFERIEATAGRSENTIPGLQISIAVHEQFDQVVCDGLRLPRMNDRDGPDGNVV